LRVAGPEKITPVSEFAFEEGHSSRKTLIFDNMTDALLIQEKCRTDLSHIWTEQ